METPDTPRSVHEYFELSYASYLVKHRTLLQSMPADWQERFVALLEEFDAAFAHVEQADGYKVTAGQWAYIYECEPDALKAARISGPHNGGDDGDEGTYADAEGNELTENDYAFIPGREPVPHYQRGRAYVAPRLPADREITENG